jgi:WD40 repeat protein
VAFQEGFVRIYAFQEGKLDLSYKLQVGTPDTHNLISVKKVMFDDSRHWLATMRGDVLTVWNLQEGGKLYWQSNIPTANEIAFDRMGKLLFIGTDSALEIWDLASKSMVHRYQITGLTALTTTPDGRLLIWGDEKGVIHLWGTPMP